MDATYQKRLDDAETELASNADTMQNFRRKIQQLEESLTNTETKLETEKRLRELAEQRETAAEAFKNTMIENHSIEMKRLNAALDDKKKESCEAHCKVGILERKLFNDIVNFNHYVEKGERDMATIKNKLETANGQTQHLIGVLQGVKDELEKQKQGAVVLQNQLVSAGAEAEKAKQDIQELQQSKSTLESTTKSLTDDKLEASKKTEALKADLDAQTIKVGELTSSLNEVRTSRNNLEWSLREYKEKLASSEELTSMLTNQLGDIRRQSNETILLRENEVEAAKKASQATETRHQEKIRVLEVKANALRTTEANEKHKISILETDASKLKATGTEDKQKIHTLEAQISTLETDVSNLKVIETVDKQKIHTLEAQVNDLQATKTEDKQTIHNLEGRFNALEDSHTTTKTRLSEFLSEAGPGFSSAIVAGGLESATVEYEPLLICQNWNGNAEEPDLSTQSTVSLIAAVFSVFDKPEWDDRYVGALMRRLTECLGEVSDVYPQVMRLLVERCTERITETIPKGDRQQILVTQLSAVADVLAMRWPSLQDLAPAPDSILAEMKAHCSDDAPKPWRNVTEVAPLLNADDASVQWWTSYHAIGPSP
ncbi:hypothetical protein BDP81DRAFT_397045 [Colletotrichum phormii]|uniref:Uncharacterized protein n=1 Tax=Colletotrichum phormii TaxID=359342 RepID=A0AAI9ZN37_9PEZI|nr:uncharacterized protein BDP81DRAFT_397045 [Colletotrichum phormii]KAK1633692.1 hypothetical protein BDP81DRAFT_397045 [Colletotrichum phormii]